MAVALADGAGRTAGTQRFREIVSERRERERERERGRKKGERGDGSKKKLNRQRVDGWVAIAAAGSPPASPCLSREYPYPERRERQGKQCTRPHAIGLSNITWHRRRGRRELLLCL